MMNLSDYRAMLDYISTHEPGHPDLERLRSRGLTLTNSILIKKIHTALVDAQPVPIQKTVKQDVDDAVIRSYNSTLNKLFTQRARLSNTFHISSGRDEDIMIGDQIAEVQNEINKVMGHKSFYLEKKELPPLESNDEVYEIPSDPFELVNKINSTSTSLSHRRRELKALDEKKEPAKYAKKQKTIEYLTKYKLYLEQAKRDQTDR